MCATGLRILWYSGSPDRAHQERDPNRDQQALLQNGHVVAMGKDQVRDRHPPEMNLSYETLQPVGPRCA